MPLNSEADIRRVLRKLAGQRVAVVLQPGNIWVIDKAVEDNEQTDAALKTAYIRGWVAPIESAVPKGQLAPDGSLPSRPIFQRTGPLWRLTEGGWAVVNQSQRWTLFAILVAVLSFAVSVVSLVLSLKTSHPSTPPFQCRLSFAFVSMVSPRSLSSATQQPIVFLNSSLPIPGTGTGS